MNGAAVDNHPGVEGDGTGRSAVVGGRADNLVDTTTRAIHIAAVHPFVGGKRRSTAVARICHTDFAVFNYNLGIPAHVAVFATTEHRTRNPSTIDGDLSRVGIAEEEVAAVVVARLVRRIKDRAERGAFRRAKHIAVKVTICIRKTWIVWNANGAAADFDYTLAAILVRRGYRRFA